MMTTFKTPKTEHEKFSNKYRHVGYSYANSVPGWNKIIRQAIINIEYIMWPQWMPMFIKRFIHTQAYGRSVYYVRNRFWLKIRNLFTNGMIITDIKEKFGYLRLYGDFNNDIDSVVTWAEKQCEKTCQDCGSTNDVKLYNTGWIYNYCADCRKNNPGIEFKWPTLEDMIEQQKEENGKRND